MIKILIGVIAVIIGIGGSAVLSAAYPTSIVVVATCSMAAFTSGTIGGAFIVCGLLTSGHRR